MEISVEELNKLLEKATEDAFKRYNKQKEKQIYIPARWTYINLDSSTLEVCRNCSNHPSNGGDGICNCILGQQVVTC